MLPLTIIGALVSITIQASNPAVLGFAIDALHGNDPWHLRPLDYAMIMASLALTRAIIFIAYRWGLSRLVYQLETDLRSIFFTHSTRLSFSYFDKMQTGQLISRANSDIRAVQMFLAFGPFMFITFIGFLIALIYMLNTSVVLTFIAVLALPGVYLLGLKLRKLMFPLTWINQQRLADLTSIVDENINGVRVVRSFAAEERQIEALAQSAFKLQWAGNKVVEMNAKYGPLMENAPRLGVAAVLFYGGMLVIEGEIGIGALVAFNLYMMQLAQPFRMIGMFLIMERRAAASAARIFEVLDETPEIKDHQQAVDLQNCKGKIQFENVSFSYQNQANTIQNFSNTIQPGECVAIVGQTGSGKTTIARLLARFYEGEGRINIDDHKLQDISLLSLHQNVGIISDDAFLFSCSVFDNIAFGNPHASEDEVINAAKAAQAHEFILELPEQYQAVVGERGYTLSGGQRQRIALARIFLTQPKILILDDASSAIDVRIESLIHQSLKKLIKNRTTIIIAHRYSTIALADRVLLIDNGTLIADGDHQTLLKNEPRYREILAQDTQTNSGGVDEQ